MDFVLELLPVVVLERQLALVIRIVHTGQAVFSAAVQQTGKNIIEIVAEVAARHTCDFELDEPLRCASENAGVVYHAGVALKRADLEHHSGSQYDHQQDERGLCPPHERFRILSVMRFPAFTEALPLIFENCF